MSHPDQTPNPVEPLPSAAASIAADAAALSAIIQLALRAAQASVTRLEDLTAKAAGWSDPRELDATLPVTRMARCIRQCIALKAKLPHLYATGLLPPRAPATSRVRPPADRRPRPEDADPLFTDHEPFADIETLDDPTDAPLTQSTLARYATDLATPAQRPTPRPTLPAAPPTPDAWRELIRKSLEPEIDALPDHDAADAIEAALSDRLDEDDFPTLLAALGPEDLTRKLRRDLGLPIAAPPGATGPPAP